MQPYLFPYLGYFQLFDAADVFVVFDDVQYINRGWINRNRILCNGKPLRFTLPVEKDSSTKAINERHFADSFTYTSGKLLGRLNSCYSKAPYRDELLNVTQGILGIRERNVADFLTASLRQLVRHMKVDVELRRSSELGKSNRSGSLRIQEIVKAVNGDRYVNPTGGKGLYDHQDFENDGVELRFLQPQIRPYHQGPEVFVPDLSILDPLAFLGLDGVRRKLNEYDLIK